MNEKSLISVDLARMRRDLEAEQERRQAVGEDLSDVLLRLGELRARIEKLDQKPGTVSPPAVPE